ncbi:MAG TPA: beta-ketoacyl synthase N-terminal-like domain-containing protein [Planctomycetota bacterium]|nr:beta-ketoacyl synthase N-terminal-like domain-containing protein [Planctomycetota bacterium]
MTTLPTVLAVGVVDQERIAGSSGMHTTWKRLGVEAPGTGRTFRAAFGRSDETFRRLDRCSRALVLATTAADIEKVLPRDARDDTALVVETTLGCLDADLRFAASMRTEMCDGPIFPYTLPSTSLGEVALRYGLRGPSICLSVAPDAAGASLAEASALLENGEATFALVATVDVLQHSVPHAEASCRAIAVLLAHRRLGLPSRIAWAGHGVTAFAELARSVQQTVR